MNLRQIQERIEELQALQAAIQKKQQDEAVSKERDEERALWYAQCEREENVKKRAQEEMGALFLIKPSFENALRKKPIEIDQIKALLEEIHKIPFNCLKTSKEINDSIPRRYFYDIGIRTAIKRGDLALLQLLWHDFDEWIPKLYAFKTTTNALFDEEYVDLNALIQAILHKTETCALWLLEQNISPNSLYCTNDSRCKRFCETALTLAIKNGHDLLAKELIKRGAWIGKAYTQNIERWKEGYNGDTWCHEDRRLSEAVDAHFTPLMIAVQKNNEGLVSFFLEQGAFNLESDENRKTMVDLTTDNKIKALLLSHLSHHERLERIHYYNENTLPNEYCCSVSKRIMTRPAKDRNGYYFCQEALLNQCLNNPTDLQGPQGASLTQATLLDLLSLPVDKELQSKCKTFVEQSESVLAPSLTYKKGY